MPIKRKTDPKSFNPGRAFATAFTLAKGELNPRQGPGEKPFIDLDYFRFRPRPGFEYLEQPFAEAFGIQPQVIPNILLSAGKTDDVFPSWFEQWARKKKGQGDNYLVRRCDGEQQVKWLNMETGEQSFEPIPCQSQYFNPEITDEAACTCVPIGRLTFLALDLLPYTSPVYGLITLKTFDEVVTITNFLRGIEQLRLSTPGVNPDAPLSGVVFNLRRIPFVRDQSFEGRDGKTHTKQVTMYMVRLESSMQILPVLGSGLPAQAPQFALSSGQQRQIEAARLQLPAGRQEPQTETIVQPEDDTIEGDIIEDTPSKEIPNDGSSFGVTFDAVVLTQPIDKKTRKPAVKANGEPNLTYTLMSCEPGHPNPILFESSLLEASGMDVTTLKQQPRGKKIPTGYYTAWVVEKTGRSGKVTYEVLDIKPMADIPF